MLAASSLPLSSRREIKKKKMTAHSYLPKKEREGMTSRVPCSYPSFYLSWKGRKRGKEGLQRFFRLPKGNEGSRRTSRCASSSIRKGRRRERLYSLGRGEGRKEEKRSVSFSSKKGGRAEPYQNSLLFSSLKRG